MILKYELGFSLSLKLDLLYLISESKVRLYQTKSKIINIGKKKINK